MKEYAYVSWNFRDKGGARAAFKMLNECDLRHEAQLGMSAEIVEDFDGQHVRFSSDTCGSVRLLRTDPRLPRLIEALRKRGIDRAPRIDRVYSKKELDVAPWLVVRGATTMVEAGSVPGQKWNFTGACPNCGSGAAPVLPLLARFARFPKTGWVKASSGLILVTAPVAKALEAARLSGFALQPADPGPQRRGRVSIQWLQILSVWPRCSAKTVQGIEDPCPECKRDGRVGTWSEAFELHYERPPPNAKDLNSTWEQGKYAAPRHGGVFADENRPTGGSPNLIISQRARRVLQSVGVRLQWCDPIFFDANRS